MLVIKYQKKGDASFISHIDLLKHMGRIIRRADIPMNFSKGFNPHPLLFFSPPMVLGGQSECEYVFLSTEMNSEEAFRRYKCAVPEGLTALEFFDVKKNPNLQAEIEIADYVYPVEYRDIDFSDCVIRYTKKGEEKEENVSSKIFGTFSENGKLCVRMAAGNSPLRPDRIIGKLSEIYNEEISLTDVVKVRQYVKKDGVLINADDFIKEGKF